MTALEQLAELLFPDVTKTPDDYEKQYPARNLKEGARVTRIAPSPTGYLHLGVLFTASVNYMTARATDGVFYFRLEDTDKKREVDGGAEDILAGLRQYGLTIDEGYEGAGKETGNYGPYRQSDRAVIYHTYAKSLLLQGLAYPCFCTAEELDATRKVQESQKKRTGYYAEYAKCRDLTPEQAIDRVRAGQPYVLRLRSPGDENHRIKFDDLIKGTIEMPENDQDIVLLKTDGTPTYHFAHAVDDHLMRTTHVIRGDEWIASVPIHLQLFRLLGFRAPKYAHVSPIMKEDDGGKRKLSKRKDPEAAVHFYTEQGYPADSVMEYLLTVANSDYEDWRRCHPDESRQMFPFNLKKMSVSGALFDLNKLNDVSKNIIAVMDAETVTEAVVTWAKENDENLYAKLTADIHKTCGIFAIDRGGNKPRKDIAKWSDVDEYARFFFEAPTEFAWPENIEKQDIKAILEAYQSVYDPAEEKQEWFESIKQLCPSLGFCPETKEYKKDPDAYKGHAGDVSTVIRIAVTGRRNTPDLCSIMKLLGKETVTARLIAAANTL